MVFPVEISPLVENLLRWPAPAICRSWGSHRLTYPLREDAVCKKAAPVAGRRSVVF